MEKKLQEELKKLGYKSHTCCGKNMMGKYLGNSEFLILLVSYSYTRDYGFFLECDIGVKTQNESLRYAIDYNCGKNHYVCALLSFVLSNEKKLINPIIVGFSENQLQFSWKDSQFEEMGNFLIETEKEFADYYNKLENITNAHLNKLTFYEEFYKKKGISYSIDGRQYNKLSAVYYLFGDQKNALKMVQRALEIDIKTYGDNDYRVLRTKAYLDYLKNGTPLKYIPSPHETASILKLTNEDIYLCLNKKTTKDKDILEYFGGADKFEKAQKISHEQIGERSEGISICKAGKWSAVRIGFGMLMQFDKEELENILKNMSEQYNRAILFVNQDTTNTFGFEVYKKGEFLRRWMAGDGEVLENMGKPITGERKKFTEELKKGQDAESVQKFLDGLIKITYGDLDKSKCVVYNLK